MMSDRPPVSNRPPDRFPQRPPFRPSGPSRPPDSLPPPHSIRLRDGDREIDVSGSPAFVRQILDDLPALLARLRGEPAPAPSSIRMPPATGGAVTAPVLPASPAPTLAAQPAASRPEGEGKGTEPDVLDSPVRVGPVDERIFAVLRAAPKPLPIAAIREELGGPLTGQQVRRILERAGDRVVSTGERPMKYRLRA
jgi:hypothetical protein